PSNPARMKSLSRLPAAEFATPTSDSQSTVCPLASHYRWCWGTKSVDALSLQANTPRIGWGDWSSFPQLFLAEPAQHAKQAVRPSAATSSCPATTETGDLPRMFAFRRAGCVRFLSRCRLG